MNKNSSPFLVIFLLGVLLFFPFLGQTHLFDWDEINFAECAREMLETGDYLRVYINYEPFWEKPPLFFWMQAGAMKLFGIGEFAARFPNAICGIVTLVFLFFMGKKMVSTEFGWLWSMSYLAGILPHVYFKSGIIDPWFNLFIFVALCSWMASSWPENKTREWSLLLAGGISLGLAVLTKGPVAGLLAVGSIGIYLLLNKILTATKILQLSFFSMVAICVAGLWFGAELLSNGSWFIREFVDYQIRLLSTADAGHKGFPGFHFIVLLVGCFPMSIFAIKAFFKMKIKDKKQAAFRQMMIVLSVLVLVLFSLVQSKIIHYSSLAYYPLSFLAAFAVYHFYQKKQTVPGWIYFLLAFIGFIISLAFMALPYLGQHIEIIRPLLEKDIFALGNIEAEVSWNAFDAVPGIILFASLVISLYLFYKQKNQQAVYGLYSGTILFVFFAYWQIVPNIEAYSQRAAIEFFKEKSTMNAHLITYGHKSYADLFYGQKKPSGKSSLSIRQLLLQKNPDKTIFVVCRIDRVKQLKAAFKLKEIGRKNGFVFYRKEGRNHN